MSVSSPLFTALGYCEWCAAEELQASDETRTQHDDRGITCQPLQPVLGKASVYPVFDIYLLHSDELNGHGWLNKPANEDLD
ncbi:hypothetical protein NDU88_004146 [Pleurodeles waltl]|uniref:Uncharacterized protein n=1 Tax=Pleurodeles waltl TaxID=8319 RepID=A0AAV7WRH0_PLEWA|nr:hypothetical protein NDU88_004146 [Pleurodeles waltl]